MASIEEILHLCRLCLVKDQVNIPIFEDPGDRQIFLKITSCLPVKVSKQDKLPKNICGGCSDKLNSFYEFWSSSANAEKTLLSWLAQQEETEELPVPKPLETLVKYEPELDKTLLEENTKDETEAPPSKRVRRTAAVKARVNISHESEDEDLDTTETYTKMEEESEGTDGEDKDPSYTEMPGTSADDDQAGPSGVGKDDVEAPVTNTKNDLQKKIDPLEKMQDELYALLDDNFMIVDADNPAICEDAPPEKTRTVSVEVKIKGKSKVPRSDRQTDMFCSKCGQHFATYYEYDKHILSNPSHHSYVCCLCTKTARNFESLKSHGLSVHGSEKYFAAEKKCTMKYYCHFCGHLEVTLQKISIHIQDKHFKLVFNCPLCTDVAANPQGLFTHFEHVHSLINNADLICNQCQYHFYDPSAYTQHMINKHQTDVSSLTYQCVLCPTKLNEEAEFLGHLHEHGNYKVSDPPKAKSRMINGRPMCLVWKRQCFICTKFVDTAPEINKHLFDAHFSGPMCPLCNEKIDTLDKFLHLKDRHSLFLNPKAIYGTKEKISPGVIVTPVKEIGKNTQHKDRKKINPEKPEKGRANGNKLCEICYALIDMNMIGKHMKFHAMRGSKAEILNNPTVDKTVNRNQYTKCNVCQQKVVATFMKRHKRVHSTEWKALRKEKQANQSAFPSSTSSQSHSKQSQSLFRAQSPTWYRDNRTKRRRSSQVNFINEPQNMEPWLSRAEMKCTECDRSYDTVENLINHVKAQHFMSATQTSFFNPFMTRATTVNNALKFQAPHGFGSSHLLQRNNAGTSICEGSQSFSQSGLSDVAYLGGNL